MMMSIERRKGASGAVVNRSLVNLDGIAFKVFKEQRVNWRLTEDYRTSGPIQHFDQMYAFCFPFAHSNLNLVLR